VVTTQVPVGDRNAVGTRRNCRSESRASRPAVGALLLITPIWIMLWPAGGYLWEYPAEDLVPLVLLAIVPAGRTGGLDRRLAPRFGNHWPF
jgi:hypothetical protein